MHYTTFTPLMTTAFISHRLIRIQFTRLCTSLTRLTLKLSLMPNLPLLHIAHLLHPTVMLVGALGLVRPSGMEPYFLFSRLVAWVVELFSVKVGLSLGHQFAKIEHLSVHAKQKFKLLMRFQNWWWGFAILPTVFVPAATTSMILRLFPLSTMTTNHASNGCITWRLSKFTTWKCTRTQSANGFKMIFSKLFTYLAVSIWLTSSQMRCATELIFDAYVILPCVLCLNSSAVSDWNSSLAAAWWTLASTDFAFGCFFVDIIFQRFLPSDVMFISFV